MTYSDPPQDETQPELVPACKHCGMAWSTADQIAIPAHPEPWRPTCGCIAHQSLMDRERFQHEALGRHNYRAWSREDQQRHASTLTERKSYG